MFKIFSTYICWINIQNVTLQVSGAVRPLYVSLGVKGLNSTLVNATPRLVHPRLRHPVLNVKDAGCGSGQVRKSPSSPRFDSRTLQPVSSRYTDWAIQGFSLQIIPLPSTARLELERRMYHLRWRKSGRETEGCKLTAAVTASRKKIYESTSVVHLFGPDNLSTAPDSNKRHFYQLSCEFL